jgi:hypothetical protein
MRVSTPQAALENGSRGSMVCRPGARHSAAGVKVGLELDLMVDASSVDRIIEAVGDHPTEVDRRELLSDLEGIASLYQTGASQRVKPAEQRQRIERIVSTARHLKELLGTEISLWRYRPGLDRLMEEAKAEFPEKLAPLLDIGTASAFENLVGSLLKKTFEKHFLQDAGYSRDDVNEEVRGAFIDFAEASLRELGITNAGAPYARNSIASALSKMTKT